MGYIFINNLCYGVKISDINKPENFKLEYIYLPTNMAVKSDKEEKGTKKKMSMKERMAAAKTKLKEAAEAGEGGLPKSLRDTDHKAIIADYFMKMKTIQATATSNFSSSITEEIQAIEQAKKDKSAKIKATNDAYWQSAEGQEKLRRMRENSGSSSSKSSSKAGAKLVNVQVNPGSKAKNFLYIHWIENGSKKSKTLSSRTTSSIGKIPEGTKLYYSVDNSNGKQVYFYQVPRGKSSTSVTVK